MNKEQIITRVEAAIEALGGVGKFRKLEVDLSRRVSISAYVDGHYSIGSGPDVSQAYDGLLGNAERQRQEAADRAAFEAWKREREAA